MNALGPMTLEAQTALAAGARTPRPASTADVARARASAVEFEGFLLSRLLQPMFEGLDAEEPFGGGFAETMWRGFQVDEIGKAMARAGGIGLADAVMHEILRAQEG